jgi:hypothetical protein
MSQSLTPDISLDVDSRSLQGTRLYNPGYLYAFDLCAWNPHPSCLWIQDYSTENTRLPRTRWEKRNTYSCSSCTNSKQVYHIFNLYITLCSTWGLAVQTEIHFGFSESDIELKHPSNKLDLVIKDYSARYVRVHHLSVKARPWTCSMNCHAVDRKGTECLFILLS